MKTDIYSELVSAIGVEMTNKLCDVFGGSLVYVPSLQSLKREKQRQDILKAMKNGEDIAAVAKRYGWSVNGIKQLMRRQTRRDKT